MIIDVDTMFQAFKVLYAQILDSNNASEAFGEIFRHVRDRPNEGLFFHCTGTSHADYFHLFLLTPTPN